ncbi:MAG: OsmC family peroxiredoxin [Thermoplasmata archaeon]|nr:OsmC family peroxiredoxin [Thermoplasmata archaeon]
MTAKRTAIAVWNHDLAKGNGTVRGTSGGLPEGPVSWVARTEQPGGRTSPEELLAAAQASCYAMAFSSTLGKIGKPPTRLEVSATCTFDKVGDAWKVTTMELDVTGQVAGMGASEFAEAAARAEQGCPISNAIRGNVEIRVTARLG